MCSQDSSLADLLSDLEARLQSLSDTPRLDAQVLLAHILGKPRSWLLAHPKEHLSPEQFKTFIHASTRLADGEPLPYVLGHWEFYGMDFPVNPQVLIPRPETELLVDYALDWLRAHPERRWAADIGTGSGCIAVVLVSMIPNLHMLATDISLPALEVARANAQKYSIADRIEFVQADLLNFPPSAPFDLLCANLPYIPSPDLSALAVTKWEPTLALDGGPDGLDLIHRLLQQASSHLASGGLILLEIEATQGSRALTLAQDIFPNALTQVCQDLSGRDRLLEVQLPE